MTTCNLVSSKVLQLFSFRQAQWWSTTGQRSKAYFGVTASQICQSISWNSKRSKSKLSLSQRARRTGCSLDIWTRGTGCSNITPDDIHGTVATGYLLKLAIFWSADTSATIANSRPKPGSDRTGLADQLSRNQAILATTQARLATTQAKLATCRAKHTKRKSNLARRDRQHSDEALLDSWARLNSVSLRVFPVPRIRCSRKRRKQISDTLTWRCDPDGPASRYPGDSWGFC